MTWPKIHIHSSVRVAAAGVLVFLSIGFTGRRSKDDTCERILITINNQYQNHFFHEQDVMAILTADGSDPVIGNGLSELPLKGIEERLKSQPFIKEAQLFIDLKGSLMVEVDLRRPVARIVRSGRADAYVAGDGTILPVSDKYVSRVVLLGGTYAFPGHNLADTEWGNELLSMIDFINRDKFWKAQVAQLDIDAAGNVTIFPQVTRQYVEFGKPENIERKFKKLEIFYKQILPQKGWNAYERVNLQYTGQIIAEEKRIKNYITTTIIE